MNELPVFENKDIDEVIDLAKSLESSESEEYIAEYLPQFLDMLENTLDVKLSNDVRSLYLHMQEENCLARIENISRVVVALEKDEPFEIGKGDSHYANAVIPDIEGIKLAYAEGQAPGPLRIMVGFGKTLLGFKTQTIEVSEVDFVEDELRDSSKRKYLCRHVDGKISREDISTVVMRIPRKYMVKSELFGDEEKSDSPFIFRGFSI